MKAGKLFQLAFSVILIACTTGCSDKDEVLEADNYQFKEIKYSFEEEGDGFSTYDVECPPTITRNNSSSPMTVTERPFDSTWQETTFQSNDPEAFVWMEGQEQYVSTPYIFKNELYSDGADIKYCSETIKTKSANNSSSTITLPPYTQLTTTGISHYSKMVATYTLVFVGEHTKTEKQIKGKFIQTIPEYHTAKYLTEEIPN